jgi:hypothetical protein
MNSWSCCGGGQEKEFDLHFTGKPSHLVAWILLAKKFPKNAKIVTGMIASSGCSNRRAPV